MKVLIVDSGAAGAGALSSALQAAGFAVAAVIRDASELYAQVRALQPDAVVLAADSPERDCMEDIAMSARTPRPVIMLSAAPNDAAMQAALAAGLCFYVTPEISPPLLRSLVHSAVAQHRAQALLAGAQAASQREAEDACAIAQAKCLLMEREQLSEAEAYHRLRRSAMNRGRRVAEIARDVLREAAGRTPRT